MQWDAPNDYVMQFTPNFRGIIGHLFCQAAREGCEDVQSILDWVEADCMRREAPVYRDVVNTLHTGEAWDFAQHMLDREALPRDEQIKLKNASKANSDFVKTKMANDEPTEKQLKYLKGLGCKDVPTSKLEASELINQFLASREQPASNEEPQF